MPSPYSNIRYLPELNNEFNTKFNEILKQKREIILIDIQNDLDEVLSMLNNEDLKNIFESNVNFKFSNLKNKLNSIKNIAIIQGITMESKNLHDNFIKEIEDYIESQNPDSKPSDDGENESEIKEISINIKRITSKSRIKIESEEQLDDFINKIKSELQKELKNNDIVNLEL